VVVLVEQGQPSRRAEAADQEPGDLALARSIKAEVERCLPELSVSIGLGPTCHQLEDYRASYERAHRSLAALKGLQRRGAIVTADQLGVYNLLFDHGNQGELLSFAERMLGPLLAYDREHGTDLVKTLDTYLRLDCRPAATATDLCIHRSTLLYRLERIEEIGKLNLRDPDVRFEAQLALRILSVAEAF
jgi:DNA-binding PucR family transcriptional regulator